MHLDTCLTAGRPRWNLTGTLFEGIQCWEEYKPFLTKQEVKERVNKAIRMQAANGIQYVRTHVDKMCIRDSYISVPLIVILGMYSMITATSEGGGLAAIFAQSAGGITLMTGIGYVIGSFISGGTATPNFIRFAKNSKIAVWTTVIAFFLGNTLMFCFGAVGGAFTGKDDIFYVMIAQGLAIPALIVLGANIWTTNNNALYTGGLAISNVSGVRMKFTTWIAEMCIRDSSSPSAE